MFSNHLKKLPLNFFSVWHPPLLDLNQCSKDDLEQAGINAKTAEILAHHRPYLTLDDAHQILGDNSLSEPLSAIFVVETKLTDIAERYTEEVARRTQSSKSQLRSRPEIGESVLAMNTDTIRVLKYAGEDTQQQWQFDEGRIFVPS